VLNLLSQAWRRGACSLFLALACSSTVQSAQKPHILFIVVDDLRPQLSVYGESQMITPNIDAMAERGLVFDNAYANVPVCGASRASMMTGLRPTRERFTSYNSNASREARGAVALNGWLKDHGYVTANNGKIHHHKWDHADGWTRNFRPRDFKQYFPQAVTKYQGIYEGSDAREWAWQAVDLPDAALQGGKLALRVESQIQKAAADSRPWFITMGLSKPHLPFVSPTRYWDMYDHDSLKLAENPQLPSAAPAVAIHNWEELRGYALMPEQGPVSDDVARHLIHGYYAATTYTDAMIGRALRALDKSGIADSTIVILLGDHGYQLGEHSLWAKHSTFRTSLQVPLLVVAPGITAPGKRTDAIVELVDLFPTICELAGIPLPQNQLQGHSFVDVLGSPELPGKEAAFARHKTGEAVITANGIYTRFIDSGDVMYYDHALDPKENRNVAAEPDYAPLLRKFDSLLDRVTGISQKL